MWYFVIYHKISVEKMMVIYNIKSVEKRGFECNYFQQKFVFQKAKIKFVGYSMKNKRRICLFYQFIFQEEEQKDIGDM